MTTDTTWNQYIDATARIREANNALARLTADTLTAQYDGAAAYLVLNEDESADFMGLVSVLDAEGACLFAFGDDTATLPPLPPGSLLADAWGSRDPAKPWTVCTAIQGLYQMGAIFDRLPLDRLPLASDSSTAAEEHHCLLLSTVIFMMIFPSATSGTWALTWLDHQYPRGVRHHRHVCHVFPRGAGDADTRQDGLGDRRS
ncbi:hypothetical protein ACIOTI_32540 [Streptomyces sp. NPDC087843]|uniref:hypothetical protein n=1 Tax=Streptomyces sp. NPDC087843 TaxID=3365804 RepID=UPI003801F977